MIKRLLLVALTSISFLSCAGSGDKSEARFIRILSPEAEKLIDASQSIDVLASGFKWTEGPLWLEKENRLVFSDIPNNRIVQYVPGQGSSVYLERSGSTGLFPGDSPQGSNGLLLTPEGKLLMFQQGDRRVATLDAPLNAPEGKFVALASTFKGKRFNSPNDGVFDAKGNLYFTDPPYGLKGGMDDPNKQLAFQGVYRMSPDGEVTLLDDKVNFPNGIGLSKAEDKLYVAVSDAEYPRWMVYDLDADGNVSNKQVFFDASASLGKPNQQGLPDGMALHSSGLLFATGPGGVWLFDENAKPLARIYTGRLTANCTLSADEKTLYMTAHDTLMALKLR